MTKYRQQPCRPNYLSGNNRAIFDDSLPLLQYIYYAIKGYCNLLQN